MRGQFSIGLAAFLFFLIAPVTSLAAITATSVRIEGIVPIGSIGAPHQGDEHVVFDQTAVLHVSFFFGSADLRKPSSAVLDLGRRFTESVDLDIRVSERDEHLDIEPRLISTRLEREGREVPLRDVESVRAGEMVTATYRLDDVPLGTYAIRARIRDGSGKVVSTSAAVRLIVSTGEETPELRALFLRHRTRQMEKDTVDSFADYAKLMTELMALQPDDPAIPERLADASIGRVPAAETIALYDRALETSDANFTKRYGSIAEAPPKIAREWTTRREDLTSFRRIYPEFAARPGELRIEVMTVGGVKKATLIDRSGRAVPARE
jgi:hypothetical protein